MIDSDMSDTLDNKIEQESTSMMHKAVLVNEVVTALVGDDSKNKVYLDVTFGCGTHTRALLNSDPDAFVIAIDWDGNAIDTYGQQVYLEYPGRFRIVFGNFANLYKIAKRERFPLFDGILADFGTSQVQIMERPGFSFSVDTDLDMRMSPQHYRIKARDIVNNESAEYLRQLFWQLGEEKNARAIVDEIIKERKINPITTTRQLAALVMRALPSKYVRTGIHPATKVFQALRILVNKELDNIGAFLPAAISLLKKGGRLGCISFHSLEDRMVKQFFIDQEHFGKVTIINKKAIVATPEELSKNPSARSAKFRVCQLK